MNTHNKQAQIRLRALPDGVRRLRLVLIALCLLAGLAQGSSTLRVTVKTVTNRKFTVEIDAGDTVGDLRKKIDSTAPSEFLNGGVIKKLILKKKIITTLEDTQKISSLNLGPDDEILCLSKKVRGKKRKPKVAPAQAEEKPTEPEQQTQQQQLEEEVEKLLKVGYEAHSIVAALQAANGDVSLAKQYLTAGGIPEDRAAALQKQQMLQALNDTSVQKQCILMLQSENADLYQRFLANQAEVGATAEFSDEVMRMFTMLVETRQRGGPARRTPASEEERARDKANVKQLMEECDVKRRQAAQAYLRSGKNFERANAILAKAIRFTDADSANINKLIEQCAVNRSVATQAYLKNSRDFDRTKAFMDDLMAQAQAQVASQTPTVAAPGPASPLAAAGAVELPRAQPAKEPQKQQPVTEQEGETDTVLTITTDMLFGDDSDDEELTEAQGPGMDQVD